MGLKRLWELFTARRSRDTSTVFERDPRFARDLAAEKRRTADALEEAGRTDLAHKEREEARAMERATEETMFRALGISSDSARD